MNVRIFFCSLLFVFFLSGCESNQNGWLGTEITREKIHFTPLSQSVVTVPTGESRQVTFSTSITLGASGEDVVFSVLGLPNKVTAVFSPSFCKATVSECPVTMTVSVAADVLGGETPVTIVGTGDASGKTTTLAATLIVLPTLTVTTVGSGTVISTNRSGIACGVDCTEAYSSGTDVTLTATPSPQFIFSGWSGRCSGTNVNCTVGMNAEKTVTATFVLQNFSLNIAKVGSGIVTADTAGIVCGADCAEDYVSGTTVILTATPVAGGGFIGWSGDCLVTANLCVVPMDAVKTITAKFNLVFIKTNPNLPIPIGTAQPYSVAIDDLNGDGKPDLAIANVDTSSNNVSVMLMNGDGSFAPANDFSVGLTPRSVVIGDFDGDRKADIATSNEHNDNVTIRFGNGTGAFPVLKALLVGGGPRSIASGDLDRDGNLDIITANADSDDISVLLGVGAGVFNLAKNYMVEQSPHSAVIRDINGDDKPDIVVANFLSSTVSVLLGNGDGTFMNAKTFLVKVGGGPFSVAVSDLDNDGDIDIVTANSNSNVNTVSLLLNDGLGGFGSLRDLPLPVGISVGLRPFFITTGDLNGDQHIDIVTANFGSSNVSVLFGDGVGGFPTSTSYLVGTNPRSVAIKDLNGDGKPDLVTANATSHDVSVLINQ